MGRFFIFRFSVMFLKCVVVCLVRLVLLFLLKCVCSLKGMVWFSVLVSVGVCSESDFSVSGCVFLFGGVMCRLVSWILLLLSLRWLLCSCSVVCLESLLVMLLMGVCDR